MKKDVRIVIIKENGNIVTIFSSDDESSKNKIELNPELFEENIKKFYEKIEGTTYKKDQLCDRHLFYLQDYLQENFTEEFSSINIDVSKINNDILLYFLMSEFNNIILINSGEHVNIGIFPNSGINTNQYKSIYKTLCLFDENLNWALADEMHFDIVEDESGKYKTLEIGEVKNGKLEELLENYNKISDRKVKGY